MVDQEYGARYSAQRETAFLGVAFWARPQISHGACCGLLCVLPAIFHPHIIARADGEARRALYPPPQGFFLRLGVFPLVSATVGCVFP